MNCPGCEQEMKSGIAFGWFDCDHCEIFFTKNHPKGEWSLEMTDDNWLETDDLIELKRIAKLRIFK